MPLITKNVLVTLTGRTIKYYKEKGYNIPLTKSKRNKLIVKNGTQIEVSVNDLPKYSEYPITVCCDNCGSIFDTPINAKIDTINA